MEWTVNCFNNLRGLGQVKLFRILYFFVGIRQALKKKKSFYLITPMLVLIHQTLENQP